MGAVKMRIPTIEEIAEAIGIHSDKWPGNCFAIASKIIEAGLMPGCVAVYGIYRGLIDEKGIFGARAGYGHVRHGWIWSSRHGLVIDPSRWVFENKKPYVYVGDPFEYDEGGNALRSALRTLPPSYSEEDTIIDIRFPLHVDEFVKGLLIAEKGYTRTQMHWLANTPFDELCPYVSDIYRSLETSGLKAFIPIDNWHRYQRGDLAPRYQVQTQEQGIPLSTQLTFRVDTEDLEPA